MHATTINLLATILALRSPSGAPGPSCPPAPVPAPGSLGAQEDADHDRPGELLALLRHPLPARLDRVPLFAPDDVRPELPFSVRIGARLLRTDLEDVEEHRPGTAVFAPASTGELRVVAGGVVQEVTLGERTVRLTLSGFDVATLRAGHDLAEPVGTLSAARPAPHAEPALAELGYLPGPHLLLRIEGLFPDDEDGRRRFEEFARARLLPALARAPSPRPAERPPRWPAPSERTLRGYVEAERRSRPPVPPEPPAAPDLGFFVVAGGRERRVAQRGPVFERLLRRLLDGLRWPLPEAPGLSRFAGGDDGFGRDDYFEHRALDLGSRMRDASGAFFVWPAGTPVFPLHVELKGLSGKIETIEGDHRLRVSVAAHHVRAGAGKDGSIGSLEPFDASIPLGGWRTSDPYLRLLGVPKGNHLHVVLRGLREEEGIDARRGIMKETVLPAWLRAPCASPHASSVPIPVPPPGEGISEDHDPRGAALLRAQLRLLKRQLRTIARGAGRSGVLQEQLPLLDTPAGSDGDWRAVLEVPEPRSPFAGDGEDPPRWPLVRTVRAVAAGRFLAVELTVRDLGHGPAGRTRLLEVELSGAIPEGGAWMRAHLLPALSGR
jgi:hypothetical protein